MNDRSSLIESFSHRTFIVLRLLSPDLYDNKSNGTLLIMFSHLKYIFIFSKSSPGKLNYTHCLAVHHSR